jgi:hypothetical protein
LHRSTLDELARIEAGFDRFPGFKRERPRTWAAFCDIRRRVGEVIAVLEKEGFIRPYTFRGEPEAGIWELCDRAVTLKAQKLLKPLKWARALGYLPRAIDAAARFNGDPGPNYFIARIYLFGSVLAGKDDVGDIDLMVETVRRYRHVSHEAWQKREWKRVEIVRPSSLGSVFMTSQPEAFTAIQKLSPYLSVARSEILLERMHQSGEPFQVIYAFKTPDATSDEVIAYDRDARSAAAYLAAAGIAAKPSRVRP